MTKYPISWKTIENSLSIYFDKNIPRWLKTNRALRKEVRRRFIEAMKKEIEKQIKEEEDLILYGDPSSEIKPIGILNAGFDKLKIDKEIL